MANAPDRLREILGARVHVRGICVGHVAGVLLDASQAHVIGFEVTSPDGAQRFLPLVAATFRSGAVDASSALLFVDSCDSYIDQGAVICREAAALDGIVASESGNVFSGGEARCEILAGAGR